MVLLGKIMILQGVGHPISCLGVCYANDPKKGGYMTPAPVLDLTTSLRGDFRPILIPPPGPTRSCPTGPTNGRLGWPWLGFARATRLIDCPRCGSPTTADDRPAPPVTEQQLLAGRRPVAVPGGMGGPGSGSGFGGPGVLFGKKGGGGTESSGPAEDAKRRTGDRPGPRKGTAPRRNVTQWGGTGGCWSDLGGCLGRFRGFSLARGVGVGDKHCLPERSGCFG